MMPEFKPLWAVDAIRAKSSFLYPGINLEEYSETERSGQPPLIIWNHRWEFDKDPAAFFRAVEHLDSGNLKFNLALLGENFQACPNEFITAKEKYKNILCYGYAPRSEYIQWLKRGTVIISTALQENFGISVIEAVHYGCIPLLPARLSYPEIIPEEYHPICLYSSEEELHRKLREILSRQGYYRKKCSGLFKSMKKYSWNFLIEKYDKELAKLTG
jgi:glycosyltransferase involved in cell wall biosynthesis